MAYSEIDDSLELDLQQVQRQQRLADILTQRAMQPIPQQSPGVRISPFQGLAKLAQAYAGNKMNAQAQTGMQDIQRRNDLQLQQGTEDYFRRSRGTGVQPDPQEFEQAADQGRPQPMSARGDPMEAIKMALLQKNPLIRQLAQSDYRYQQELRKPREVSPGSTLVYPGKEFPDVSVPARPTVPPTEHSIPQDWEKQLPPGAQRRPGDGPGIYIMKSPDGRAVVYQMKFENGKATEHRKLDEDEPAKRAAGDAAARGSQGTIQDPLDNTKTLLVHTGLFDEAKYKASGGKDRTGVIGFGPKPSSEGVDRAEGFAEYQNLTTNLDKLEKQIELTEKANLKRITGLPGAVGNIPGFAGADAQTRLDALKDMINLDVLQALRNAGTNNASGLGQVTQTEHKTLRGYVGNLEKAQSEKEMRRVLSDIKTWVATNRANFKSAYDKRFNAGSGGASGWSIEKVQ